MLGEGSAYLGEMHDFLRAEAGGQWFSHGAGGPIGPEVRDVVFFYFEDVGLAARFVERFGLELASGPERHRAADCAPRTESIDHSTLHQGRSTLDRRVNQGHRRRGEARWGFLD